MPEIPPSRVAPEPEPVRPRAAAAPAVDLAELFVRHARELSRCFETADNWADPVDVEATFELRASAEGVVQVRALTLQPAEPGTRACLTAVLDGTRVEPTGAAYDLSRTLRLSAVNSRP